MKTSEPRLFNKNENFMKTPLVPNIGVQYIHYQLCHYLLQCSNADWALESKYKLHLQMIQYTMMNG